MTVALQDTRYTFLDLQKMLGPNGESIMPAAEVLNQVNTMLQDGPMVKSNAMMGDRVVFRRGLPQVSTGKINQGVPRSKTTTEQHTDTIGFFVARSEVDMKEKHIIGESLFNQQRAEQDLAYVEAFAQYVAGQLIYGSILNDESSFDGLATRMPNLQRPLPGNNGSQILSNGAVVGGDGTSMYIVDWNAERGIRFIYPMNAAAAGLTMKQFGGEDGIPVNDDDGNSFQAAVTEWYWTIGLGVKDPRHMARTANVDISDANMGAQATQAQLFDALNQTLALMPSADGFQRVIYVHPLIEAAFRSQVYNKNATMLLRLGEYLNFGQIPYFANYPIRRMDQILTSEGTVS